MSLASPNLTTVPLGSPALLIDSAGNQWGLTLAGVVTCNGKADTTTHQVSQIALVNGVIWQESTGLGGVALWWASTTLKPGSWVPANGESTSPIAAYLAVPPA